ISAATPGPGLVPRGLPEPFAKRTVEGDLGVRVNARAVVELAHTHELRADLAAVLRRPEAQARGGLLAANTRVLAQTEEESHFDVVLASACADIAVERHVGHVRETYAANGPVQLLYGKDLRRVRALIGVGGVFAFGTQAADILRACLARKELPHSMRPEAPALFHDAGYVFYAMGLLAGREPTMALRLLKSALVGHA
ncbi:MAG TPA: glutamate mutase L, partial [Burkholderiales bacterium]|nr:glutamate mutase L [Burkholderiales bacterium]